MIQQKTKHYVYIKYKLDFLMITIAQSEIMKWIYIFFFAYTRWNYVIFYIKKFITVQNRYIRVLSMYMFYIQTIGIYI